MSGFRSAHDDGGYEVQRLRTKRKALDIDQFAGDVQSEHFVLRCEEELETPGPSSHKEAEHAKADDPDLGEEEEGLALVYGVHTERELNSAILQTLAATEAARWADSPPPKKEVMDTLFSESEYTSVVSYLDNNRKNNRYASRTTALALAYYLKFSVAHRATRFANKSGRTMPAWFVALSVMACQRLAVKMEDGINENINHIQMTEMGNSFSKEMVVWMEEIVLNELKWEMNVVTPFCFADRMLRHLCTENFRVDKTEVYKVLTSTIKDAHLVIYRPSLLALAALVLVVRRSGRNEDGVVASMRELLVGTPSIIDDDTLLQECLGQIVSRVSDPLPSPVSPLSRFDAWGEDFPSSSANLSRATGNNLESFNSFARPAKRRKE